MDGRRRTFLQWAAIAPAVPVAATAAASSPSLPEQWQRRHFAPLQGERFTFELNALESVGATLVRVEALESASDPESSFRLLFSCEQGSLPQETLFATHATLGRFPLFVSPNDAAGREAEAVFNRG